MQLVSPRQSLGLLTDFSGAELTTLKQFGYSGNAAVLHTDSSVLRRHGTPVRRGTIG
jgi:predicted NAD/FAD-binding protein